MFIVSEWNKRKPKVLLHGKGRSAIIGYNWRLSKLKLSMQGLVGFIGSHYSKGFEMKHRWVQSRPLSKFISLFFILFLKV
jgi:hypothetical protein